MSLFRNLFLSQSWWYSASFSFRSLVVLVFTVMSVIHRNLMCVQYEMSIGFIPKNKVSTICRKKLSFPWCIILAPFSFIFNTRFQLYYCYFSDHVFLSPIPLFGIPSCEFACTYPTFGASRWWLSIFFLLFLRKTLRHLLFDHCFFVALFTMAKTWKQPKCPAIDDWIKKKYGTNTQWNTTKP